MIALVSHLAQAETSPSQIIAEYIIGGGGLALAVALFRAGSILGGIKQMISDHDRRLSAQGDRIDRVEDIIFTSNRTRRRTDVMDE